MRTSVKIPLRSTSPALSRKLGARSCEVGWKSSAPPRRGNWRQLFDGPFRSHGRRSNNLKPKAKSFREHFDAESVTSLHQRLCLMPSPLSLCVNPIKNTTRNPKSSGAIVVYWLVFIDEPSSLFVERFKPSPLQTLCAFCSDGSTSLPPPGCTENSGSKPSLNNWRALKPLLPPGSPTYSTAAWPITGRTHWIIFVYAESSRGDG